MFKEILSSKINQIIRIIFIVFKITNSIEIVMLDVSFQLLDVLLSTQLQKLDFFLRP